MSEIAKTEEKEEYGTQMPAVTASSMFNMRPRNLDEAMRYAELIAQSDMVPKDYKGKPANIMVAIQYGAELGLPPLQACQGIAVINGRPSVWGDHLMAIVRSHPLCHSIVEVPPNEENGMTATCIARRHQADDVVRTFSMDDAKRAGLANKDGPWKTYPQRMLQMRARAFALRDQFPDVLRGMSVAEEMSDVVDVQTIERPSLPEPAPGGSRAADLGEKLAARAGTAKPVDEETGEVDEAAVRKQVRELHEMLVACTSEDDFRLAQAEASELKPMLDAEQLKSLGDLVKSTAKKLEIRP